MTADNIVEIELVQCDCIIFSILFNNRMNIILSLKKIKVISLVVFICKRWSSYRKRNV